MNDSVLSERYTSVSASDDTPLEHSMESRKQALTTRFLVLGMLGILMISVLMSLGGYIRLQYNEALSSADRVHQQMAVSSRAVSNRTGLSASQSYQALGIMAETRVLNFQSAIIYDHKGNVVWQSKHHESLPQNIDFSALEPNNPFAVVEPRVFESDSLLSLVTGEFSPAVSAMVVPLQGKRVEVLLSVDNSADFEQQRVVALRLMLFLLLSTALLFSLLYFTFLRGIKTIEEQEHRLNQQISRLSNLLTINKGMQRNVRTASARAVELNEQFLRRTGADLHDGPAQMIGFSIMRLNQALEKDESGLIGPEFHAIKQALEESLEEIRGISSGLVLPELETMTLEQCMRKVVLVHTSVHKTEVNEFYSEIDQEIPLPIKISAYRFVQEGLNNAHRHGKADACRLTVSIKDDFLQIALKDNGVGFRKSQLSNDGKHLGLIGLKDRIESLGGRLAINSELGVGTSLKLSVPLSYEL